MKTTFLFLLVCAAVSCGRSQAIESSTHQTAVATPQQNTAETATNKQIAVGPIELFASWKGLYVKLERWRDDPKVPHPELFDVLCTIENKADSAIQEGDFVVVATIDFIIAPTYVYSGDVNKIIQDHNWGRVTSMDDLRIERVPYLRPHADEQIKIKGFNLGKVVNEFNGKNDTLWPWALRVNVRILSREMTPVTLSQVVLHVIPADARLAAK